MSELAFNINGEAFEVVESATGWRVRKMRAKGPPEVVYAREGQPLVLPITADIDDLRAEVDTTGRYRLDLVDQNNKTIEGAPSGYVQINVEIDAAKSEHPSTSSTVSARQTDNVVIEAMRMNTELAKSIIDRFPLMLEASAHLLRAADGAGLPARIPREVESDDNDNDDDDSDTAQPVPTTQGFDFINSLVLQLVPVIINSMSGKKLPGIGELLDWRKARPKVESPNTEKVHPDASVTTSEQPSALPPLDPKMMGHFIAIQSALAPAEAAFARQLAAELSPAEMRAWFDELTTLSVPDAVTKIRSILSTMKAGGAS